MMKPYSSYKDTNLESLEQIPSLWEVLPLKRVINKFVDYRGHTPDKTDSGILLITAKNIRDGHLDFDKSREYIAEEDYDSWMVRGMPEKGDVMVTTEAPLGAIAQIESENVALAQRLILLKANKKRMDNTFIKYYFLSQFGQNILLSEGTGSTAIGIKASKFYNINIIIPPISEQQAIADFLDHKTVQIDTLIEKKQRQIDLLQEQRTALINHAVTKGLNPDVRMKDSGVEWIGDTPNNWQVMQIRRLVTDHKQGFYTNEGYVDEGTKLLRITDIDDNSNVDYANCPLVDISENEREAFGLEIGDFVFARSGSIGRFGIIREKANVVFASYLIRFRFSDKAFPEYIKYYFLSYFFRQALISDLHGGANQNIHAENIKNQFIVLPPVSEQKEIVSKLDQAFTPIAQEIEKMKKEIELILEYRTALISEAVTGKIDVRTAV